MKLPPPSISNLRVEDNFLEESDHKEGEKHAAEQKVIEAEEANDEQKLVDARSNQSLATERFNAAQAAVDLRAEVRRCPRCMLQRRQQSD